MDDAKHARLGIAFNLVRAVIGTVRVILLNCCLIIPLWGSGGRQGHRY